MRCGNCALVCVRLCSLGYLQVFLLPVGFRQCSCCDGSDSSASCRRLSGRFLSFLLFARLLCFSAFVCHRCLAEPLPLLLSIFTFHVLFFISPSKRRCSPAFIGLPVPSSSSLVSLLPPAGPNRSKLQDMLANLRDAEDLPSMQPAVTPPSRSSVPRLNEHEVGRPDDGSPPSVSAQRSCVSDVNVQTFPVSVLQRR